MKMRIYPMHFDRSTGILCTGLVLAGATCSVAALRYHGLVAAALVALAIAVLYLCRFLSPNWTPVQQQPFSIYLLCFFMVLFPSAVTGVAPMRSLLICCGAVVGFIAFYAIREAFLSRPLGPLSPIGFAALLATGCSLSVLSRLMAHLAGWSGSYLPWYCLAPPDGIAGQPFDRLFSFMLVSAIPFVVAGAVKSTGKSRTLLAGAAMIAGIGIILSFSRAAWIAAGAELIMLAWLGLRRRQRLPVMVLGATCIALLIPTLMARGTSILSIHNGSDSGRLAFWGAGIEMIAQRPFLGTGLGTFQDVYPTLEGVVHTAATPSPHNLLLHIGAECGLPGLCIFIGCVFSILRHLSRQEESACPSAEVLCAFRRAGAISFTGLLVFSMFHI